MTACSIYSEAAIAEREKRQAAFHEAGHSAVCLGFGGAGKAEIWRNTAQNVDAGEKAWLGHFKTFAEPGTLVIDDQTKQILGVLPVPNNWRVLFGMAGLVAERIADGITDAEEIACSIDDAIDADEISRTDHDAIGVDWSVSDVTTVVQLLLNRWPAIERNVTWMTCE